jgi:hypothetical protein
MKTPVDDTLRAEAAEFRLRFTCEHCVHFVPERAACAHGYPAAAHHALDLAARSELEFCKEFELV